jgi:large subunit ribosomal protein L19
MPLYGTNVCPEGRKNKMDLIKALSEQYVKAEAPVVEIGDTVRVNIKVKEGNRERIQAFDGTVIAKKHGGINETITVRRISYNVGCEKVFPVHSPNIESITVIRHGKVRRAKLYYLRDRVGKAAKTKEQVR